MSIVEKIKLRSPLPIAKLHEEMRLETVPLLRIYKLINLFEGTVQYMVLMGLSYYRDQKLTDPNIEQLRTGLNRPSLGHWVHLLRGLSKCLRSSDPNFLTADPMHDYKDEPIGIAVAILRDVLGLDAFKKVQLHHFLDTMIEFRNKKRGHGELSTPEAEKIQQPLEAALNQWIDELSPLYERYLLYISEIRVVKGQRVYIGVQLNTGTSPDAFRSEGEMDLVDKCIYLYQPDTNKYTSLWPFMTYNEDSRILYTYHEVTDQGEVHLRCLYNSRGTDEWLTVDADNSIVLGGKDVDEINSSQKPDRQDALKDEISPEGTLEPETDGDHYPQPVTNISGDIPDDSSSGDKDLVQKKLDSLEVTWDTLQKRIVDLREEWVNETRTEEKERIRIKIKKIKEQQGEIEPELNDLKIQLYKLDARSQHEIQKLKYQSEVKQSQIGLSTLDRIMQDPQIHAVIAKSSGNFDRARKQINIMQDYKHIHDSLHDLEFRCFRAISQQFLHFPNKVDFGDLSYYLLTLSQIKKRIQDIVLRGTLPQSEDSLLGRLDDAEQTFAQALKTRERELFDKAVRGIAHVLKYDLSRINQRLSNAASSLSLPDLIDSMEQVRDYLVDCDDDPVEVDAIEDGIKSLRNLDSSLSTKTREHSEWQEINDELRLAETELQSAIDQWPHMKERLSYLCGENTETLVVRIRELCDELDRAVGEMETKRKLKDFFKSLNRLVGLQFQEIDIYLRNFYDDVKVLDEPITSIMRQIL